MFLRYVIIFLLFYLLFRLIRSALRELLTNYGPGRNAAGTDGKNVNRGKKVNLDGIQDAKFEEIDEDADKEEKKR